MALLNCIKAIPFVDKPIVKRVYLNKIYNRKFFIVNKDGNIMENRVSKGLIEFLNTSHSHFHAVENIKKQLMENGFVQLSEGERWSLEKGKNYLVTRNDSSIIAFRVPENEYAGFNIVASHSDSPCFKIKEKGEMVQGEYVSLNTERYGGMIMSTWLDRPLSVAGRIIVKTENGFETKLVDIDKNLLIIPNLAVHMDRTANDGKKFNPQTDMLPLFGDLSRKGQFEAVVAQTAGVKAEDIVAKDLYLYNRDKACFMGLEDEFIGAGRLDDLQCAYTSMDGFLRAEKSDSIAVLAVFDNEEVGSETKQGAASTFLYNTLTRINMVLGGDDEKYMMALENSFMISADNAHAVHPNNMGIADPTNRPYINKGVVIKHNANQRYTTDAVSNAAFKSICEMADQPVQHFANRSDILGGGTLGNISNNNVALNTVDIGLPQFAMHSSFETAGVKDTESFAEICRVFYSKSVVKKGSSYTIK